MLNCKYTRVRILRKNGSCAITSLSNLKVIGVQCLNTILNLNAVGKLARRITSIVQTFTKYVVDLIIKHGKCELSWCEIT